MTDTATAATTGKIQPRLKQKYRNEIAAQLKEQFGFTNVHQVPGLVKVVVNTGVGKAARDSKVIEGAIKDLTGITGQKPQVTAARKSIAQFKLREGQATRCARHNAAETAPGSSSSGSSRSRFRASEISVACRTASSTATATTPSVSQNSPCPRDRPDKMTVCAVQHTIVTPAKRTEVVPVKAPVPSRP